MVTDGNGEFFGHESGAGSDDGSAENVAGMVGEDFDEAIINTVNLAGRDVF